MTTRPRFFALFAIAAAICLPAAAGADSIGIAWRTNLDAAKLEAAQSGKLLLLHFYTQSCQPCRVLDQTVLNQPQVGAAIERDYVPVKIDSDAQPALRNWYKIEKVPAEVVLMPDGAFVTALPIATTPNEYVDQAQNLARHVRQSKPGGAGPQSQAVNSAYAGLPVSGAQRTAAPQGQMNQYVAAAPAGTPAAGGPAAAGVRPHSPSVAPAATGFAASGAPSMPPNAMPNGYRNPMFAAPPIASGPAAAGTAAPASRYAAAMPGSSVPSTQAAAPVARPTGAYPYPNAAPAPGFAAPASASQAQASAPLVVQATQPAAQAPAATHVAAAPPQGAVVRPAQPPLPPGSPPVALDGCCPVTLKAIREWKPGSTVYGAVHRGRTYLFLGEQQRQVFMANPDAYSPVFAGYDPVLLLEKQQTVPGAREFGYDYGGSIYLFSSKETMARFAASPHTYAAGVRLAMAKVDGAASGTIRR